MNSNLNYDKQIALFKEQINNIFKIYHIKQPNKIKSIVSPHNTYVIFEFYSPKITSAFLHEFKKMNNFISIYISTNQTLHCMIKLSISINEVNQWV